MLRTELWVDTVERLLEMLAELMRRCLLSVIGEAADGVEDAAALMGGGAK